MRSPSSLIFLVLLGVWAAYFLQYWIRRRDHLATARTVEQFSEAMRVLERRDVTPRTDLSEPAPRSWNLHPATASRPQVLVKRAVPAEPAISRVTAQVESPGEVGRPAPAPQQRPATPRWVTAPPTAPAPAPTAGAPSGRRRGAAAPGPARVRPGRRVRAALFLTALVELVAIAVIVPLGLLPLWALAPAGVAVLGAFAYVRAGVRAERALRAARRRRRAEEARRRADAVPGRRAAPGRPAPASSPREANPAVSTDSGRTSGEGAEATPAEPAAADASTADLATPAEADAPADSIPAVSAAAEEPVAEPETVVEYVHLVDEDDIPLTWDPVPVPRPTYTMKARAERPEVPPAEVTPDPEPVALPEESSVDERRVAGA